MSQGEGAGGVSESAGGKPEARTGGPGRREFSESEPSLSTVCSAGRGTTTQITGPGIMIVWRQASPIR